MSVPAIIDDLSRAFPEAATGTRWALITDRVMGGVSNGNLTRTEVHGRPALRMTGGVSLANNGGFVQMALDLAPGGGAVDARGWAGIEVDVLGNGESYGLHLRTTDMLRPWQSFRQGFVAPPLWQTLRLPFAGFAPHRTEAAFAPDRLRRLGLVATGRAFAADLAVARIAFWR